MTQVKLILKESIHSLGEVGDLVSVKPGYARNYLIPRGKAILATESRVAELEHHKRIVAEKVALAMKDLQAAKERLEAFELEVTARAGEEGRLFGSVTTANIGELLAERGFVIDRRRIELKEPMEPIKALGEHVVPIKLHREVIASVKLTVRAEGAEEASPVGEAADSATTPSEESAAAPSEESEEESSA
jgi:large subunit ribosomal protein L9